MPSLEHAVFFRFSLHYSEDFYDLGHALLQLRDHRVLVDLALDGLLHLTGDAEEVLGFKLPPGGVAGISVVELSGHGYVLVEESFSMRAQHADHVLQDVQTQAKGIDKLQDGEETASAPLLTFPEELYNLFRRCLRIILVASTLIVLNERHFCCASSR